MEWQLVLLFLFGSLTALILSGLPVAFCFVIVDVVGVYFFWGGETGLGQLILSMVDSVKSFTLLPILFFILLGEILFQSGMAGHAIEVIDSWLGHFPGRLGLAAVGSGVVISTLSGSSTASAAMLASTLVPEMEKRGYKKQMSLGPIMGSGGLAIMIPPSSVIVFLAALASLSVAKCLMAGIMPGLLMGALYATYIILRSYLQSSIAPPYKAVPIPLARKLKTTVANFVPVAIIIFLVTGVIFLGIATPSEAAATGAFGAFFLAAAYRHLSWKTIKASILPSIRITVMILTVLLGATAFAQILAFTGCTRGLVELVSTSPLPPIAIIIGMLGLLIIMGCFMDTLAVTMMLIPIYMPIVYALSFNPIWFIILFLLSIEMGLTTPPFGMILFVVKGAAPPDTTMGDIYRAGLPFLACDAIVMALIMLFPQIVLWLPSIVVTR